MASMRHVLVVRASSDTRHEAQDGLDRQGRSRPDQGCCGCDGRFQPAIVKKGLRDHGGVDVIGVLRVIKGPSLHAVALLVEAEVSAEVEAAGRGVGAFL